MKLLKLIILNSGKKEMEEGGSLEIMLTSNSWITYNVGKLGLEDKNERVFEDLLEGFARE